MPNESQNSKRVAGNYPNQKLTIVGGGIIGFLEAYYAYLNAQARGERIRVTIYDKNKSLTETTTANIVPSLTPDEILSVVPRGQELINKLKSLFSELNGIRVDDVNGVNDSSCAKEFVHAVQQYGLDEEGHRLRTDTLLALGKMSMDLWQEIYSQADEELKAILIASHFNPCREHSNTKERTLHDGYRIDIMYNLPNALNKANAMKADYERLGYRDCKILTPLEALQLDPSLADFCKKYSATSSSNQKYWNTLRTSLVLLAGAAFVACVTLVAMGSMSIVVALGFMAAITGFFAGLNKGFTKQNTSSTWRNDAVAIWRPGGCIDTHTFLPLFHDYLKKVMGQYTNDAGVTKDCFRLRQERKVEQLAYDASQKQTINGLKFQGSPAVKHNNHAYAQSDYVFCPGENVGTLTSLGLKEPEYARFAGASLKLMIDVPKDKLKQYTGFNHCMEVHQEGVVLAWQARLIGNQIFIGVGGTKAFYGDQEPHKDQAFAKNRNLLQLNVINDVMPECISWALGRPTLGVTLTEKDMAELESRGIALRWVGSRAVAYDGFPTLGSVYTAKDERVDNGRTTTSLGSGGASFGPGAVRVSQSSLFANTPALTQQVLSYADSNRTCRP